MQVILQNSDYFGGGGKSSDNILFLDLNGGYKKNSVNSFSSILFCIFLYFSDLYTFLYFYISRKCYQKSKWSIGIWKDAQWKDAVLNDAAFFAHDAGNFFFQFIMFNVHEYFGVFVN